MKYLNIAGYIGIPLAFVVHLWLGRGAEWEPIVTFILAGMGVIPLAHMMGEATEDLADRTGPTWGGLLNATFGNAAELIIAIIALSKGLNEIVKASLTGSILGNLLLVAGAAMLAGGWKREKQHFSRSAAEANAGLLTIAVAAMLLPAIFHFTAERMHDLHINEHEYSVSMATSIVLLLIYGAALLFTLRTHAHVLSREPDVSRRRATGDEIEAASGSAQRAAGHAGRAAHGGQDAAPPPSVKKSVLMLLLAAAGIGIVAELLVGSAEQVAHRFGLSEIFIGVILLAIIGNAAEHSTAILMAIRDDMDTAMTITYQSSLQIALFVVPIVVLLSSAMAGLGLGEAHAMNLVFTPLEIVAVILSVFIVIVLCMNGQTNWFEGVLLLALYLILAIAFFFIPAAGGVAAPG